MFQGFYDLTSNMITQNRNLNIISNNMSNVSTPGFKMDRLMQSTFRDEMIYRYDKYGKTAVGTVSRMNIGDERITDYTEGGVRETGASMDVGLIGSGFFEIQTDNGMVYTRNGSFNLDDAGYLVLPGFGRVQGTNGPIRLTTDEITIDETGNITGTENGQYFGRIRVVDFQDYDTELEKTTGDMFVATGAPRDVNTPMRQKFLEDSNVDVIKEYTQMMATERALQSAAQVLRMYDQLAAKIVQIGPT